MDRFKSEERRHPKFCAHRPHLHGSGQIFEWTRTYTDPLFVYSTEPKEPCKFLNGDVSGKLPPTPPLGQHQHLLLTWGKMLPQGRGKWAVSQKCIMILNSTAICNRIWTVPCYRVSQVKEIVRSKICLDSGKNPSIPARYRYASVYNIIANCSLRFSPESRKCLTFLFFCQPCHECMAIGYKRCYKCYGRGRVRIAHSFSHQLLPQEKFEKMRLS